MRILLACEESQAVCLKFREMGHDAFSADILECTGGHPEWHIQGDVIDIINQGWDMLIAFPPCTHLAVSGARHFKEKIADGRQQEGIDFSMKLVNAPIERICVENPICIMSSKYKKPTQIIHPWQFGHEADHAGVCAPEGSVGAHRQRASRRPAAGFRAAGQQRRREHRRDRPEHRAEPFHQRQ